jgi:hypothetical protein
MAFAKKDGGRYVNYKPHQSLTTTNQGDLSQLRATAQASTTVLGQWTFDSGALCVDEGWVSADITAQLGDYWHVENFVGMGADYKGRVGVINGNQSLWCGARPSTLNPFCGYAFLPGYGNNWNQAFCTTNCVATGPGAVVQFWADWDSEPGYDATTLEVTNCTGAVSDEDWVVLAGGTGDWDGNLDTYSLNGDTLITLAIPDTLHGSAGENALRVRLHFLSDGAWSDEDGLWNTDGAIAIDDLSLTGLNGGVAETFEDETVGDTSTLDGAWSPCTPDGYGDFSGLFNGLEVVLEDPCTSNITCMWGFFNGSTADYGCGGFPGQAAVPYENLDGLFINNEIWSPDLDITASSGVVFQIEAEVYRDLRIDPLVFYVWHVQSKDAAGCYGQWRDRNFVYYGPDKDWILDIDNVGDLVSGSAVAIRVAYGVVDMAPFWRPGVGSGACHSHSPLFDNMEVRRIAAEGPQWSVRDIDQFQDTFPTDGTTTGTARIDMALDRLPYGNPFISTGDSAVVQVSDPEVGLAADAAGGTSWAAVYGYVRVEGPSAAGLTGALLEEDGSRWPVVGTRSDGTNTWFQVRCDTNFTDPNDGRVNVVPDKFCLDLNDQLFGIKDVVLFFYGAENTNGVETFLARVTQYSTFAEAATNADECTILPGAGAIDNNGDILYVDGMNFRGAQQYFDTAFDQLGLLDQVDRYDIRGPSSQVANRPGARVGDPAVQLIPFYKKIIWNTGDLSQGSIGDGNPQVEKSDDAFMLLNFLDGLDVPGGVYFNGDNIAQEWVNYSGSAIPLRDTYIQHTLINPDHTAQGFAISPLVIGEPGGAFDHLTGPDTLVAYGGCPVINDFDVMDNAGPSTQEAKYDGGTDGQNGAIIAQYTENLDSVTVGVVLSGFSFHFIRDDRPATELDRAHHLRDVLVYLGNNPPTPTPATPTFQNTLSQNYPNPFNPTTTIDFTVKELAPVTVKIYNVRGQLVKTLVNDRFAPGVTHQVTWDGRNDAGQAVSSGVYFYKLVTKSFTQTKKMVLLK